MTKKAVFSVVQSIISDAKGEEEDARVTAAKNKLKEVYQRKASAEEIVRNIEREAKLIISELEEQFGEI